MEIYLGIAIPVLCTGIFAVYTKRLYSRRYCHRIFLHSFHLLFVSYLTSYGEAMLGLLISCILFLNKEEIPFQAIYFGTAALIVGSSVSFITRVLRQYRIYLLTYIELGRFKYATMISIKPRLLKKWNYIVGILYVTTILSIVLIVILLHSQITNINYYHFLTYLVFSLKLAECFTELTCFFQFKTPNIYKIETFTLVLVSILNTCLIMVLGMHTYLTYSIVTIIKTLYVIFNDLYIFCILMSTSERRPLLPPICMIQSSLFAVEIKLVYDIFSEFLNEEKNKSWIFLLEFLMEIQMLKFGDSQIMKERLRYYLERVRDENTELWSSMKLCENENFEEQLSRYESDLINALDVGAFAKFIKSPFYLKLEQKFNHLRVVHTLNHSF